MKDNSIIDFWNYKNRNQLFQTFDHQVFWHKKQVTLIMSIGNILTLKKLKKAKIIDKRIVCH